ncbi:MAG: response regulator [Verrucomicrobiaceae bacterium]|nr:MAG: response regulator [Verrucomicrobiaceae bacterium]
MHTDILIAEHDVVSRTRLKAILQGLGYTPRVFDNGWEAWNAFEEQPSHIVICDSQTPGLDGVSFCERVRSRPNTPYAFFILVTPAFTATDDCKKAVIADVNDFLVKPLRRDAIWRRLHVARRTLQFTNRIQRLEEVVPTCIHCKRILEEDRTGAKLGWQLATAYRDSRISNAHGSAVCPDCMDRVALQ